MSSELHSPIEAVHPVDVAANEWHVNPFDPTTVRRGRKASLIVLRDGDIDGWDEAQIESRERAEYVCRALRLHPRLVHLLREVLRQDADSEGIISGELIDEITRTLDGVR